MTSVWKFVFCLAACALLALPRHATAAEETRVTNSVPAKSNADTNSPDTLRAYLQLQEQLHAAQLAIERPRQDADSAAQRNADALTARLQALQDSLVTQRARELEAMQGANRLML